MPIDENGLYVFEDISFVNTSLLNEAARHFKKFDVFTKAPKGSKEYIEFWDIEEDRRKNGITISGRLTYDSRGGVDIQRVHITGKHYGFLNYGRILMTPEEDDKISKKELKFLTGNKPKDTRRVGKKTIDFPRFIDGQYHYFKAKDYVRGIGKHIIVDKARRKGYSYMEGWDTADEINMNPFITVLVGAYDYKYITVGNQIVPMSKRYLDFLELNTDFNRGYLKETVENIKLGYKKTTEGNKEFGYQSQILALSFKDNPDAGIGKDAALIKLEEGGRFPNLKSSLASLTSTTEDGDIVTGSISVFGVPVGAEESADWQDFEEIFYSPAKFGFLALNNIWDEGMKGTACGFFHPQEIGDPAYLDEHGNSLKERALASDTKRAEEKKRDMSPTEFVAWRAQRARCPKESFASGTDNIYPSIEINEQLNKIEHDPDFKYLPREGILKRSERGIRFVNNIELRDSNQRFHDPVNSFPLKSGSDVNGCYVEWMSPYRAPQTGKIPKGLYRVWHDPYAHSKEAKEITLRDSLGTAYVYERTNNITPGRGDYLCASLIGRPANMDEYNENLLKLVEYWGAELMFENDRGDVKGFFARNMKSHLLVDEPNLEWEVQLRGKTGRGKGMHMTPNRKGTGAIYLRDWLMEKRGEDTFGNTRYNLHYIYDPALLRELLKWNIKGNFDRVSALLVGMYDMKECFNKEINVPKKEDTNNFFSRKLFT